MNIKRIIKNNLRIIIIIGIIAILGTVGITLALNAGTFNPILINTTTNKIDVVLDFEGLSNTSEVINTNKMLPISDSIIEAQGASIENERVLKVEFNVTGVDTNPTNTIYDIAFYEDLIDCVFKTTETKWKLYKDNVLLNEGNLSPTFDAMENNRLVLTNTQETLTTTPVKYTFILWISERCTGDITECNPDMDQSEYLNKTLNGAIKVELSTGSKKELTRTTNTEFICSDSDTFTINYDANGGIGAPDSQNKLYGESITLSSVEPTRAGYDFGGWSTSPNSESATYGPESTFTVNSNTTLYAVWDAPYLKSSDEDGFSGTISCTSDSCNLNFLGTSIKRNQISTITFTDSTSVPEGITPLDVSEKNDGRVKMWYTENTNGKLDVTIGSTTGKVFIKDGENLFAFLTDATSINFNNAVDTSKMTTMFKMFNYCQKLTSINFAGFTTSNVTNIGAAFQRCESLVSLDIGDWDVSNVTLANYLFNKCHNLITLNVSKWNTSKITTMAAMFQSCYSLSELDLTNWNVSNVTDMTTMFATTTETISTGMSLTTIGDVSNWNTSKLTNITGIFQDCTSIVTLNLSNWDTSNVTNMYNAFRECHSLTDLDVSNWDTSKVTNMESLFFDCGGLTNLDLSSWNTSAVTNMKHMFRKCSNLETIYIGDNWNTESVTDSSYMFFASPSLIGSQGTTYNANFVDATYARVDGGTSSPGYLTYKASTV